MKHLLLCIAIVIAAAVNADAKFEQYQWALENRGEPQTIELDHITTYKVQSRKGEDLRIPKNLPLKAKKVVVAVLDTGFDFDHPAFQGRVVRKESECKALEKFLACVKDKERKECEKTWMTGNNPEVDQDKNGYPMDCQGWSVLGSINAAGIYGRPDFSDDHGHGTHVAGIINSVAKNIQILPVQVLGKKPTEPLKPMSTDAVDVTPQEKGKPKIKGLGDIVARAMNYAINSGAEVVNFSMGWPATQDSDYLRSVVAEAQRRGIIIVAAAGNDATRALLRPCAYPGVICVGSHGPDGSLSHFSNYGSGVDVVAPGTNILSTYPLSFRPVRFRESIGFEYLHGTSQASPQVAGVVAEMIAQGIPKDEIYPRLILGSRKLKEKLPLLEGAAHDMKEDTTLEKAKLEPKFILSGQIDFQAAMNATLNPLILPADKEKKEITWDRKNPILKVTFPFKNYTRALNTAELQLQARYFNADPNVVRPQITSVRWLSNNPVWNKNEVRDLEVTLAVTDTSNIDQSRIVSDLDIAIELKTKAFSYKVVKEAEITVPIADTSDIAGLQTLLINNAPQQRVTWVAIDENIDGEPETDYMAVAEEEGKYFFYLMKQKNGKYELQGSLTKRMGEEDLNLARIQVLARLPSLAPSSQPLYAIGILVDRSEVEKTSSLEVLVVDSQMKIQQEYKMTSETVQLPTRLYWQRCANGLCPTWFGLGYDPKRKRGLRDRWENPDNRERPKSRLYYKTADGQLHALESMDSYEIIDLLNPSAEQKVMGRLPVLLAKNQGSKQRPSYLYDFKLADVEIGTLKEAPASRNLQGLQKNLLDTRVDEVLGLDAGTNNFQGTFWFATGPNRTQRLTVLNQYGPQVELLEQILPAARGTVDSALRVRAAYAGRDQVGAFSFSNSEVQYHDLKTGKIIAKSLERYTFFPDQLFTAAQFPVVIADSQNPRSLIPGLFTTEESGLNRGVKIKAALRNQNGELTEIASPAKLRYKTSTGCKPLATPVRTLDGVPAFDYFCGNKIIRAPLIY